ncbi:MAG: winged helix-turn-helix transcriptional regulator [Candidatus Pacearchaeota archaeon]|jgi:DNA-binding Lrp family transcriptional regulator
MTKKQETKEEGWIVKIPKTSKEIKLDKKDRLIIQTLLENARTTLPILSKITNLSKNSIINRMKNYEKIGLTNGSSTFIAMHRLGLEFFSIGIKTKMTLLQKEKFIEQLKKINFVNQILVLASSHWDFFIRVYAKDSKHFDKLITQISKFKGIVSMDIIPVEEWNFLPTKYLAPELNLNKYTKKLDTSFQKTFSLTDKNRKISFDKKDLEILNALSGNTRIPLIDIASKIKISPDAVKYRINNLIKNKIIENFFININPFLLGYNAYLFAFQIFNREKINEIVKHLATHPKCTGVIKTNSNWNLLGAVLIKDTKELKEFEEKFFSKFENYIHNYEFIQILEQPHYKLFIKDLITKFY